MLPLAEVERRHTRWVLDQLDGNKSKAADLLGITRSTLYRILGEAP
ncbi:MAG: helix-turn-helix domain-containing protein [Acidobacteriota bacterium]|jgi:DNA-binding protein Fis